MRFSLASGVRNDLLQVLVDNQNKTIPLTNTIAVSLHYGLGLLSPHTATVRDSYTVPVGKGAIILSAASTIYRETTATNEGNVSVVATLTPNGGSTVNLYDHRQTTNNNDLLTDRSVDLGIVISPGDEVDVRTADPSTGGTVYIHVCVPIIQYDL